MEAPWTPVIVTWKDAFSPDGRRSKDFVKKKIEPCIRRTIGFVLRDDDENVVVAMEDDRDAQDAIDTDDDCENITVIPRSMVVRMDELAVRRNPRKPDSNEPSE